MTNNLNVPNADSAPSQPSRITLSQVIAALAALGIHVESPVEQMEREEHDSTSQPPPTTEPHAAQDGAAGDSISEESTVAELTAELVVADTVAEEDIGNRRNVPVFSGNIRSPWSNNSVATSATTVTGSGDTIGIMSTTPATAAAILPATGPAPAISAAAAALAGALLTSGPAAPAAFPTSLNAPAAAGAPPAALHINATVAGSSAGTSAAGAPATVNGFVCASCNSYNLLRPATETWYAVVAGRDVGVFKGWHSVQSLVSGVPHASYKKYPSEEAARRAFQDALAQGIVVVIN